MPTSALHTILPMSIITNKIGSLEILTAEGIEAPHCFTTRYGGVSTGIWESMNIGPSRGDDLQKVVENYRILGDVLGFIPEDVVIARQTHSDIVRTVTRADRGAGLLREKLEEECDALITGEPGVALMVSTADCTPILFWDPVTGAVGAAHAGWRGTASAIGAKTVEAMCARFGCKPENIRAAIGPNIGPCCFETDADVPNAMVTAFGDAVLPFIRQTGDKHYVNLKEINALVLRRAGVKHIDISTDCTKCQPQRFWSHRITGLNRGSQGAIIRCKEEKK